MQQTGLFHHRFLPLALMLPQLAITAIFFLWPAFQALLQSFFEQDAFGLSNHFVGLGNFTSVLSDPAYFRSLRFTLLFSAVVAFGAMGFGLLFAVMADQIGKSSRLYQTLFIWPYAVAPAMAGVLWLFLFNPSTGAITQLLSLIGIDWNYLIDPTDATILVLIIATWKQISYNFIFFLAGLQSIPKTLLEAAEMDGASRTKRFWTVIFPLLTPTSFFLMIVNITYAFFDTFGIIHMVTQGGPGDSTQTLVYKVWYDGFQANALGTSAAQSVLLMIMVSILTILQFRYVERKVHY